MKKRNYNELSILFLKQNICCGYSKEPSQRDGSFEHPKLIFRLIDKQLKVILYRNIFCLFEPMFVIKNVIVYQREMKT